MQDLRCVFINWVKNWHIGISNLLGGINKPEAFLLQLCVNRDTAKIESAVNHTTGESYQTIVGFNRYYLYFFYVHRYLFLCDFCVSDYAENIPLLIKI